MVFRIEIRCKEGVFDAAGESVCKSIQELGFQNIKRVQVVQVYTIDGAIDEKSIETIKCQLLVDPLTQDQVSYSNLSSVPIQSLPDFHTIEIAYNPGVMDPVEQSTLKGIQDLGVQGVSAVRTAKKYLLTGQMTSTEMNIVVNKILANKLIQHVVKHDDLLKSDQIKSRETSSSVIYVELIDASDRQLSKLSQEGQLFLNLDEMKAIQKNILSV